ncbi:MAG: hypothetical protein HUU32_09925 [Calditrichaceae bacterium]|nr:Ig-like domain-containing protein [Calditrichia bacterium]NUQ41698.1 hypothetical protein [Calditrichaceae bacterium]
MKSFRKMIPLIFLALPALLLRCDVEELLDPDEPPVIQSLKTANDFYQFNSGDTVTVMVLASNPEEGPLSYAWSASGGELLLPRDREQVKWIAPAVGGLYDIVVKVSNLKEKSVTDTLEIQVISPEAPLVEILSPREGDFLVQFTEITLSARAFHVNGLQTVSLFVNDTLKITRPYQPGSDVYNFNYTLDLPGGPNFFRVEAVAGISGAVGADEVRVIIEVILPKGGRR